MFKLSALGSYFAGIATVVVALSAGFAGGAHVGSSWGSIEHLPAMAANESRPILDVQRREIPLVQAAVAPDAPDQQAIAAKAKADKAKTDKVAAARKEAAERRKIARAEWRKNAERNRQIAVAASKMQASAKREELTASTQSPGSNLGPSLDSSLGPNPGAAPQAQSQPPPDHDGAPGRQAP